MNAEPISLPHFHRFPEKTKKAFSSFWGPAQVAAFKEAKLLIALDVLLAYPNLSRPFDVEVNASDYQLGGVVKQDGVIIACFSRKLNTAQRGYTTIEKELLSAHETLTYFRSLLKGAVIRLHTDHKNLTFKHLTSDRCLHWRNDQIEAFDVTFIYKPGPKNLNGDLFSRHSQLAEAEFPAPETSSSEESLTESLLKESFWNTPNNGEDFPLNLPDIADAQATDQEIQDYLLQEPEKFEFQNYGGSNLACRRGRHGQWKIVLPSDLVGTAIKWYHALTAHGGQTRTRQSMEAFFWYPNLRIGIEEHIVACDACQRYKDSAAFKDKSFLGMKRRRHGATSQLT
jgi:hypothetical protein